MNLNVNLNDKQLSFLIAFLIMAITTVVVFNISLSGIKEPEYLFEIALDEVIEELEPVEEVEAQELTTHMAFNEAVKSRFDEELESFKTLEEIIEEGKANEAEEASEASDGESGIDNQADKIEESKVEEEKTEDSNGDDKTEEIVKNNTNNRNTTISYSLKDRLHRRLPNPIYTCSEYGKIVINIKVDKAGNVIRASFNQASSTSKNGCLIDNAIAYALKAKFAANPAKNEQPGTITYQFQQD